ncbi:MAG TPA: hypothetical protein VLA89_12270 [Gemmatimonadales bacterium]|nr:hypothetical protein [Gemmatimonadales bacterium]
MRDRNAELTLELHLRWRECALCGETEPLTLHHISNKPRDDVEANLVMLCGSGTTGCHGMIEAWDPRKRAELATYIREHRMDTCAWLDFRFFHEGADNWLRRVYGA